MANEVTLEAVYEAMRKAVHEAVLGLVPEAAPEATLRAALEAGTAAGPSETALGRVLEDAPDDVRERILGAAREIPDDVRAAKLEAEAMFETVGKTALEAVPEFIRDAVPEPLLRALLEAFLGGVSAYMLETVLVVAAGFNDDGDEVLAALAALTEGPAGFRRTRTNPTTKIYWEPLTRVPPSQAARRRCACGKPGMYRAWGFGLKPMRLCLDCERVWEPAEGFGGMPRYETGAERYV